MAAAFTSDRLTVRVLCVLGAIALGAALVIQDARAQAYPSKTIAILTPVTAGAPDLMQRAIADSISTRTGVKVVIEPRTGAQGALVAITVANAQPDGYTVGIVTSGALVATPLVNKEIKYDPIKSFRPVALLVRGGAILISAPKFPANNLAELIKLARTSAEPVKVAWASLANRLALLAMADAAKIKFLDVPFNTIAQMNAAVLSGDVDIIIQAPGSVYGMVKEGRFKPIATGDKTRDPLFPEVGTISEVLHGQFMNFWFGMVAPAGTPADRVTWLERETIKSLDDSQVRARMYTAGMNVVAGSAKALAEEIVTTNRQFARVVREHNISQN